MRRLRIEESSANKVTRNPTVNRLKVEFHDPIDVKRTSQKDEIDLFKQGRYAVDIMHDGHNGTYNQTAIKRHKNNTNRLTLSTFVLLLFVMEVL